MYYYCLPSVFGVLQDVFSFFFFLEVSFCPLHADPGGVRTSPTGDWRPQAMSGATSRGGVILARKIRCRARDIPYQTHFFTQIASCMLEKAVKFVDGGIPCAGEYL
nr:hypothetical protein CFP56_70250 [Quercus suber]